LTKDFLEKLTGNKIKYHHHAKPKRQLKAAKFAKLNKLRWLQSMYKKGKEVEDGFDEADEVYEDDEQGNRFKKDRPANIGMNIIKDSDLNEFLDAENFLMNENMGAEKEAEDLIKWYFFVFLIVKGRNS
jgi:hypothetical protein